MGCTGVGVVGCTEEGWERKAAPGSEATQAAAPFVVKRADAAALALTRRKADTLWRIAP